MKKIDWKKVVLDAVKSALAVIVGALFGSCTVYHMSLTKVDVPDSCVIRSIDNSVNAFTTYMDSVVTNYKY